MKTLLQTVGISLIALSLSGPAFGQAQRSMKIGVLNDASGPYSDNGGEGSVTAAKMAAEDFMPKHPDFKVEIVWPTIRTSPTWVPDCPRWIDQEKVDAIADVPNSAVGFAINEVVRGTKAAIIASSAASSD